MNEEYDLRESVKALGKLTPVLKDAFGNVIDGLHRLELYPDWPCVTVGFIDTPQKLEAARLAVNTNRRLVSSSEIEMRVTFLTKAGLNPEEIAKITGLSERTIYRHIPQDLKKPEAQAISEGLKSEVMRNQLTPVSSIIKTQETPQPIRTSPTQDLIDCANCHMATHITKAKNLNGKDLCPTCYERLAKLPKAPPKTVVASPVKESWEQRKAVMSPQHSKLEFSIIEALTAKGVRNVVQDRMFCVTSTTPDIFLPDKNLAVYLDGPVHMGKEDRDEQLRDLLTKWHNVKVAAFKYDEFSVKESERITQEILKLLEA